MISAFNLWPRRILAALLSVLAALLILAACGGVPADTLAPPRDATPGPAPTPYVQRYVDEETGVTCYVVRFGTADMECFGPEDLDNE